MFEWDEAKRLATLEKHGIDFVRAAEVFSTPHVVLPGRSDIETRQVAVGEVGGKIIAVVFTMRGEVRRLISARRARANERENYRALVHRGHPQA
jgi:uncharacterized protein